MLLNKYHKPEDGGERPIGTSHGAFLAGIADAAVAVTEGCGRRLAVVEGSGEDVVEVLRLLDGKEVDHDARVIVFAVVIFPIVEIHQDIVVLRKTFLFG